jgi:hypothetical protein
MQLCRIGNRYVSDLCLQRKGPKNESRIKTMAVFRPTPLDALSATPGWWPAGLRPLRRRIDARAGHALEILGHAIEYLTDEHIHHGGTLDPMNPEIEAVQLLMAANRAIYFACPVVPTLGDRVKKLFGIKRV